MGRGMGRQAPREIRRTWERCAELALRGQRDCEDWAGGGCILFCRTVAWRGPWRVDAGMARPAVRLCAVYRILAISHYRILNLYLCLFGLYVRSNNSDIGVIAAMLLD